jgi:hypothetical protein
MLATDLPSLIKNSDWINYIPHLGMEKVGVALSVHCLTFVHHTIGILQQEFYHRRSKIVTGLILITNSATCMLQIYHH